MSADIIRFIARPNRDRKPTDFPTIAFRSVVQPADLAMNQADTAPSEYVPSQDEERNDEAGGQPPGNVV
jgi:hypothetical protein